MCTRHPLLWINLNPTRVGKMYWYRAQMFIFKAKLYYFCPGVSPRMCKFTFWPQTHPHTPYSASRDLPGLLSALCTRSRFQSFCSTDQLSGVQLWCSTDRQPTSPAASPACTAGSSRATWLVWRPAKRNAEFAVNESEAGLLPWALHGAEWLWAVVSNTATSKVN